MVFLAVFVVVALIVLVLDLMKREVPMWLDCVGLVMGPVSYTHLDVYKRQVEAAFAEARAQGRADDIERVEASNGDVYFYSTTYLTRCV